MAVDKDHFDSPDDSPDDSPSEDSYADGQGVENEYYDDEFDAAYDEDDVEDEFDDDFEENYNAVKPVLPLWDFPTRAFHWLLVCLIPTAWLSAEFQEPLVHKLAGCSVLVLVLFRIVWGVVGSRHSRFIDFLVGPRRLFAYIKGRAPAGPGHNPLGGWSVIVLLVLLFMQALSGLFNSDDIMFTGPLYYAVDKPVRAFMGATHDWAFNLLLGFIALHISAVLYHQFKKKKKIIQAMWWGRALGREGKAPAISSLLALVILAVFGALLWFGLSFAPGPPPSPWDTF